MDNKKLRFLTLGTLFAVCGCNVTTSSTPATSSTGTQNSSSSSIINEYTVTWIVDGETSQETYFEGEMPVYKYGTEKEADEVYTYTFIGWDKEIVPVVEDVTYEAVYEKEYIEYVVTWIIEGAEEKETYHYNDMPYYKNGTPSKAGNAQYSYEFTGWDKELVAVTSNATYTAEFSQSINEYEITFIAGDETKKVTYMYGEMPSYEGTPTKAADAQYTYTFTGWDKEFVEVTEDATYTALFDNDVNKYTITWVVGGNEITEEYEYGQTPEFKGSTDRESAKYTYTFSGWEPAVSSVTGDQTYVAQYDEVIKKFAVNFYNEDGTLLQASEVEYDGVPTYAGEIPTKAAEGEYVYVFAGWENRETNLVYDGELPSILGAVDYYATYKKQGKPYDVAYNLYNVDGTLIESKTTQFGYHSLYTLNAPEVAGKVANTDYVKGYMEPNASEINFYYSELDTWDGTTVSSSLTGEGTEANPYLISSGADLAYIRDQVNSETTTFADQYFKLTKSIDLNDVENFTIGTSETVSFAGHLDGNNCSIRGVNVSSTSPKAALFHALVAGGSIENLAAYGKVSGGQYVGGIVGRSFGTLLNLTNYINVTQSGANAGGGVAGGTTSTSYTEGCVNYGTIECTSGNNKTAGITGLGEGGIKNCTNFGTINGNSLTGGVVGESYAAQNICENLVNYGTVTVKSNGGGVIGQSTAPVVKNIYNYGYVKNSTTGDSATSFTAGAVGCVKSGALSNLVNYGNVDGSARVGGITGQVDSTGTTSFDNCINYGKVTCSHKSNSYGGGVLGAAKTATVTNCINYGDVVGKGYYLGGILGVVITSGVMTINDCENHGSVTASANAAGGIVGGPVNESKGEMYVSGCINTGAISAPSMAGGIVGKMTKGAIADDNVNSGVITATTEGGVSGEIIGLQK